MKECFFQERYFPPFHSNFFKILINLLMKFIKIFKLFPFFLFLEFSRDFQLCSFRTRIRSLSNLHPKSRALISMLGESAVPSFFSKQRTSSDSYEWNAYSFNFCTCLLQIWHMLKIFLAPTVASCINPRTLKCILFAKRNHPSHALFDKEETRARKKTGSHWE